MTDGISDHEREGESEGESENPESGSGSGSGSESWPDGKPPGDCEYCGAFVPAGEGRIMMYPEPEARFCDEDHLERYLRATGAFDG